VTVFVGVDPDGTWTGIVARKGDLLLDAEIVHRDPDEPDIRWATRVISAIDGLAAEHEHGPSGLVVAVESVDAPTGQRGSIDVTGLLGAAVVFGAVLGRYPAAMTVAPGGHGSAALPAYPPGLRTHPGKGGGGKWSHARSAWDIAGTAQYLARVDAQ
jgi:hypothetical protein